MSPPEADPGRAFSLPVRQLRVTAGPAAASLAPPPAPSSCPSGPASPLRDLRPLLRRPSATSAPPRRLSQHAPHTACSRHALQPSIPRALPACPTCRLFVAVAGEADGGRVAPASPERRAGLGGSGVRPESLVVVVGEESCIHAAVWPPGSHRHRSPVRTSPLVSA